MLIRLLPLCLAAGLAFPAAAQAPMLPTEAPAGVAPAAAPGASRLSDLIGVEVISSDIKRIGEVEDVLLSPDGRITTVVIGVGGVLGVGEKSVAVPYSSLLWNYEASPTAGPSSSTTGGIPLEEGGFLARRAESTDPGPAQPEVTGTVGNPNLPQEGLEPRGSTVPIAGAGEPRRAVLSMTEAQIESLPEFRRSR